MGGEGDLVPSGSGLTRKFWSPGNQRGPRGGAGRYHQHARYWGCWPPVDSTQRHARHGMPRSNQLGLRARCSHNKSSRCSRAFQHLRFDHELVSLAGMQAGFGKATSLIHGTGWRWRNSLEFPRMLDSPPDAASLGDASLRTMRSAEKPQFGVHLAANYGPKRSNSNRLAGSCLNYPTLAWVALESCS
jgi:hypothetical protein